MSSLFWCLTQRVTKTTILYTLQRSDLFSVFPIQITLSDIFFSILEYFVTGNFPCFSIVFSIFLSFLLLADSSFMSSPRGVVSQMGVTQHQPRLFLTWMLEVQMQYMYICVTWSFCFFSDSITAAQQIVALDTRYNVVRPLPSQQYSELLNMSPCTLFMAV